MTICILPQQISYQTLFFSSPRINSVASDTSDADHLYGNSPQLPMIGQPVGMFLFPQRSDWSVGGLCSLTGCSVPGYCQSWQLGTRAGPHPGAACSS